MQLLEFAAASIGRTLIHAAANLDGVVARKVRGQS